MKGRIGFEGEAGGIAALDVDQKLLILGTEAVEQFGMDGDAELVDILLMALHQGVKRALELDAHGHGTFYDTLAVAVGAIRIE